MTVTVGVGKTIYPDGECFGAAMRIDFETPEEVTAQKLKKIWEYWEDERLKYMEEFPEEWENGDREDMRIFCEDRVAEKKVREEVEDLYLPVPVFVIVSCFA